MSNLAINLEASTIKEEIELILGVKYDSIEDLKNVNKDFLFDSVNNDGVIDLTTLDGVARLYVDFNSSKFAELCGVKQSSISDKIRAGLEGHIYYSKDINVFELVRYLLQKNVNTISVNDFRECVQESVIDIVVDNNYIYNGLKVVKIKKQKETVIDKISNYVFVLENYDVVNGEAILLDITNQPGFDKKKKYRFIVKM